MKEPPPVSQPPPDSPMPPLPPTPGPPRATEEVRNSPLGAVGTVLIVFAALLVLHVLDLLPLPFVFAPLLLVYIGFRGVRHTEGPARIASIIFMTVGVIAQIGILSELSPSEFGLLAPLVSASGQVADRVEGIGGLIVLGLGIYMIRRHHLRAVERATAGSDAPGTGPALHSDVVNQLAIFSGSERRMTSERFAGGRVTTIFGGAELDLRDCEMEAAEARLHMACIFGGAVVRVPAHWDVLVEAVPIFGGIGSRSTKKAKAAREAGQAARGRLVVTGAAIFGGIDVKVS